MPRAVTLDPLVGTGDSVLAESVGAAPLEGVQGAEQVGGPDAAWLGHHLGVHRPVGVGCELMDAGAKILDDLPALPGRLDRERRRRERLLDGVGRAACRAVPTGTRLVLDAGDRPPATRARGPRACTTPVTTTPCGSATGERVGQRVRARPARRARGRGTRRRSRARHRAPSPRLTFGRGEKPCENASGSSATRNARSNPRARSRCARRSEPCRASRIAAGPGSRRHRAPTTSAPWVAAALPAVAASRGSSRRGRDPDRCPDCRRPAGPRTRRRARAPGRCTRHSRSRASTGSRATRARRVRHSSPARGSRGGARPRCGPRAAPRPRGGDASRTSRGRAPRPPCASSHRVRSKRSLHSWNVPPARQTRSITRPIRRSPRLAIPSANVAAGSCHLSCTPVRRVASRSSPTLRRSSSTLFWPNHWNGVCGFGTKPPTDAVQLAPFVWRRPISTTVRASSAMPSVSSSVSVGRPVRK